jgi:hypothetical protein
MSKPQLVIQDFGGEHGKDLTKTTARLIKGGSWKRQRVIVVIPSADMMPAKVALSLWNLAFPPNNGVVRILALGQEVGEAYSNAIEQILAHPDLKDWEYLLTIEHDNLPPGDGVLKLIERMENNPEFSGIGGLYFTKGAGGVAQCWGDVKDPVQNFRPQPPDPNGGLVECVGTGMGFNLWRMSMFRDPQLRKPWFKTLSGIEGKGQGTQDLYFWTDARKYGYRCAVDCSVKVGHLDYDGKFGEIDTVW